MERYYWVYILTNRINTVLYTGITSDLSARIHAHREKLVEGFTKRFHVDKLVYYEGCEDVWAALTREKQIKAGSRAKKMALVDSLNPKWEDLSRTL